MTVLTNKMGAWIAYRLYCVYASYKYRHGSASAQIDMTDSSGALSVLSNKDQTHSTNKQRKVAQLRNSPSSQAQFSVRNLTLAACNFFREEATSLLHVFGFAKEACSAQFDRTINSKSQRFGSFRAF
jgi:hypothetical protein